MGTVPSPDQVLTKASRRSVAQLACPALLLLRSATLGLFFPCVLHKCFNAISAPIYFIVLACFGLWNTHVILCIWDLPKVQTLAAQLCTAWALADSFLCFWITVQKANVVFGLGTWTTEICTVLLADVLELVDVAVCQDKTCSSKGFRIALRVLFFTWPHPPSPIVFRGCHGSHHERTTILDKSSFELNGIFTPSVKRYWYGSY